ncbi:hypothetical protein PNQ29_08910 [Halobacterium salinarum]|nr:hypothetical protein [Halobacterium salinarum]MDL0119847.1 hypothetical protein [Halobacterium salinarum]MDL0123057.1 hypothetical protein [Halobacterium salinarum]
MSYPHHGLPWIKPLVDAAGSVVMAVTPGLSWQYAGPNSNYYAFGSRTLQ